MTRNEAAERLISDWNGVEIVDGAVELFADAVRATLTAERRATVERIRERLADNHNTFGAESYQLDQIEAILDEVAAAPSSEKGTP